MKIYNNEIEFIKIIHLIIYYSILRWLPSYSNILPKKTYQILRYLCCKRIFKYCGKNVNIEKGAFFGSGIELEIGDNSGIGVNCVIPSNTIIGANVLMGPNCYILNRNHRFDRIDIPIREQRYTEEKKTIIEDDVWIGRDVMFTPGRTVKKGTIIGARTCLCKDFPEYSIVGGNPSKLIRMRNENSNNN